MISYKPRSIQLPVRISLLTNNLLTNEREIAEMKKFPLPRSFRITNVVTDGHLT